MTTALDERATGPPVTHSQDADPPTAAAAHRLRTTMAAVRLSFTWFGTRKTLTSERAINLWKGVSLPYPEPGVRLIPQDEIASFDQQMKELKDGLQEAVERLDRHYEELKAAARRRLGDLYNPADDPHSLGPLFAIQWDFPSVEHPTTCGSSVRSSTRRPGGWRLALMKPSGWQRRPF